MLTATVVNSTVIFLNNMVQKDPVLTKPVIHLLGYVIDFIYIFVSQITIENSLGISIIILTIFTKFLMLPLAFNSQKHMSEMQKLKPEIDKIREKYGKSTDPEIQKKISTETQALYANNKINPLSGCLPLLIQFPIFIALSYLMNHSYLYIKKLGLIYEQIAVKIMETPGWFDAVKDIAISKLPNNITLDIGIVSDLEKVLNKFKISDWNEFFSKIPVENANKIKEILVQKDSIEYFIGINLVENAGLGWPGVLIPILSAVTSVISSLLLMKQNSSSDPNAMMQQKVMLFVMPIMMGYMTISFPSGVGVYWITTSVFQIFQQMVLNKYYSTKS